MTCLLFLVAVVHSHNNLWSSSQVKYLHIMNEVTVLLAATLHLLFSAFVDSLEARADLGFALTFIIILAIAVNFISLAAHLAHLAKLKMKRHSSLQKHLKS